MNKFNIKLDVLKKNIARLIKAAPAKRADNAMAPDPLSRIIKAFLEYDCDEARASVAERKIMETMVDYNELRVTPAIELAALLGVRYAFAESRCSALHRTLQSIFDREHHMRLDGVKEMKKAEIRPYFQSLAGITPYVEAAVAVDCFGLQAAPVDTKLYLWLVSKEALPEGMDLKSVQQVIEKQLKGGEAQEFFHGSRKELEDWSPKSWPQVAKVPSPILAPPVIDTATTAAPGTKPPVMAVPGAKPAELPRKPEVKGDSAKKPVPIAAKPVPAVAAKKK